jgi:shikimate kinase
LILFLVGMPGSWKSTVGRQLSRRLGLPFFDSDHVIEQRLGCSIREYFDREGEAAFREVESRCSRNWPGIVRVVATGGGAFLRESQSPAPCERGAR